MKTLPSKELLSEVLKIDDICGIKIEEDKWVCILYHYGRDICEEVINIYELAHKCKEWAFSKGYKYKGENEVAYVYYLEKLVATIIEYKIKNWFNISIDFQACEWIMEQTK